MDGPVFDAMLKTALEEALRQDLEEAPPAPRPSRRQKRRMRRLLAASWGWEEEIKRRRSYRPARWLAAAIVAALLTGTAAGYALRSGVFFQRMFEESDWASRYGGAADTEQLLGLGGSLDTISVEENGLRLELLDAVSDGQFAMVCVQLTVLDKDFLTQLETPLSFREWGMCPATGNRDLPMSCGLSVLSWMGAPELEEGQYRLVFSVNDSALADGGRYKIYMKDAYGWEEEAELPGEWDLFVTLQPAEVRTGAPGQICRIGGTVWTLKHLAISPLVLNMEFSRQGLENAEGCAELENLRNLAVRMKDGTLISCEDCVLGSVQGDTELRLTLEFQMPLDAEHADCVLLEGQEILLEQ